MSSFETVDRFARYVALGETPSNARVIVPSNRNLVHDLRAREIYSYGRHFPLARFVPATRGHCALWVVNGDRWTGSRSTATHQHQDDMRSAIALTVDAAAKLGKRIESIIIPFSALNGAGIDIDTIRPIHVRADRDEKFTNSAKLARYVVERLLPSREHAETVSRIKEPSGSAIQESETLGTVTLHVRRVSRDSGIADAYDIRDAKLSRSVVYRGYDYSAERGDYGHGMMRGAYVDYDPPRVTLWIDGSHDIKIVDDGDANTVTLEWTTSRHWLGDSLFSAKLRNGKRMRFLSSFDYNEPQALYFLAALPRSSRATTVDAAVDDLAPPAVHAAYARGLAVERQGDIFFIPTPLSNADVYARAQRRTRLTVHTRGATPRPGEVGYRAPMTAKDRKRYDAMRRKLFHERMNVHMLSDRRPSTKAGWRAEHRAEHKRILDAIAGHERRIAAGDDVCTCDRYNNAPPCEICGLPRYYHGYTVDMAKLGIARETAKLAEWPKQSRNRDTGYAFTKRTRDVYAADAQRACYAWQQATIAADAKFKPQTPNDAVRATLAIHGTAHTATEVAVCQGGVTYVRGIIRHDSTIAGERWRRVDHRPLKLAPDVWYVAVRNTVPRQSN
jgi:hypothetical protein